MMALVCMMMVSCAPDETGLHQGREYVDLGLSVKWATCNVGAASAEEYGYYFAWGETDVKERYDKENCLTLGALSLTQRLLTGAATGECLQKQK